MKSSIRFIQLLRLAGAAAVLPALLVIGGCGRTEGGSVAAAPQAPERPAQLASAVPLGDVAGAAESTLAPTMTNPFANSSQAVQQGYYLYVRMNCAGCHGYAGEGGIGPTLSDRYWRYGGTPVGIFKSLYEGRPQGMPAWTPVLPPSEIWKIVAWIESLGGSYAANDYQAMLQGDEPADNVSPHAVRTIAANARRPFADAAANADRTTATAPSRPDPGGHK